MATNEFHSSDLLHIYVIVLDENDNAPTFVNQTTKFSVLENLPAGVFVGSVHACDEDVHDLLQYSILDNEL